MEILKRSLKATPFRNIVRYLRTTIYSIKADRANSIMVWTIHDQDMLEFYSHFLAKNDLCFDVGANIGNRTKIFLALEARVIAVEPQAACVKKLKKFRKKNRDFMIVKKALGHTEGKAELLIGNTSTLSSLSPNWIHATKQSGRFSTSSWDKKQTVSITTLDSLIGQYGLPSFIKIDVEGYEYEVIKGLSTPIKAISFEFTPELLQPTFNSIDYFQHMGEACFNFSLGESAKMFMDHWVSAQKIKEILAVYRDDVTLFGDIYVRFDKDA